MRGTSRMPARGDSVVGPSRGCPRINESRSPATGRGWDPTTSRPRRIGREPCRRGRIRWEGGGEWEKVAAPAVVVGGG